MALYYGRTIYARFVMDYLLLESAEAVRFYPQGSKVQCTSKIFPEHLSGFGLYRGFGYNSGTCLYFAVSFAHNILKESVVMSFKSIRLKVYKVKNKQYITNGLIIRNYTLFYMVFVPIFFYTHTHCIY